MDLKGSWATVFSLVNSKQLQRRALIYFAISLFLILFNFIYSIFSHGVHSPYMQYVFLVPLILGTVVLMVVLFLPFPSFITSTLWRMGIATLVSGFLLRGVFDIYGTEVPYIIFYLYAGIALLASSLILYMYMIISPHHHLH